MAARARCLIAALILIASVGFGTTNIATASAPTTWHPVVGRVVDGDGGPQYPSSLVACPYVGSTYDCSQKVVQPTGPFGVAVLRLNTTVRYHVFAAVKNPNPPWSCPGLTIGPDIVYLSDESFDGLPRELPHRAEFTIVEPSPSDCAPVTVVDDAGNPIPGAGLFVDDGFGPGLTDAQGVIRVDVEPGVVYEIGAFLSNSGWPCPAWVAPDGSSFHFSEPRSVSAEELLDGETFVIRKPDASECAPPPPTTGAIRMFDEAGSPLPQAIISYCEYDPATPPPYPNDPGTDCPRGSGFRGPDADGVIRVPVNNLDSNIDITGFLACTDGWFLFGDYNKRTDNGYTYWTITADDLVTNGLDLEILGDVAECLASTSSA